MSPTHKENVADIRKMSPTHKENVADTRKTLTFFNVTTRFELVMSSCSYVIEY